MACRKHPWEGEMRTPAEIAARHGVAERTAYRWVSMGHASLPAISSPESRRGVKLNVTAEGRSIHAARMAEVAARPDVCRKKSESAGVPFIYVVTGEPEGDLYFDTMREVADAFGMTVGGIQKWFRMGRMHRYEAMGEEREEWCKRKAERLAAGR